MKEINLLVVDDHKYFRESFTSYLKELPFVNVIAEAEDGMQAEKLALDLLPDMIIMDIRMPEKNGIDAAEAIKQKKPAAKIILYSGYEVWEEKDLKFADRFIPKEKLFEDILSVIKEESRK